MTIRRVAVVYDDRPRPETTGQYCLAALRPLADVVHVYPDRPDEVRASARATGAGCTWSRPPSACPPA